MWTKNKTKFMNDGHDDDDDDQSYGDFSVEVEEEHPNPTLVDSLAMKRQQKAKKQKSLRFDDTLTIRNYDRILGDNPSCLHGPPLTIDWNYQEETKDFHDFEQLRTPQRRSEAHLRLHSKRKRELLLLSGVTEYEMERAIRKVQKARLLRQQSAQQARFSNDDAMSQATEMHQTAGAADAEIQDAIRNAQKAQQQRRGSLRSSLLQSNIFAATISRVRQSISDN